MKRNTTRMALLRICAAWYLWSVVLAAQANGQASPPSAAPSKGTKQRISNPLNDLLDEARRDIDKQDFAAAIVALQRFLAEKDDFAYAHFQLGYAYTALQKPKEARSEYERAMQLDPQMPEAPLNLGILLLNEEPAAAVAPLRRAVELLPAQSKPRSLLGLAYLKSGDLKNSEDAFEGALALDPKDTETSLQLAQLYLQQNRPLDAQAKFRAAIANDPKSPAALAGLAAALEAEKKPEAVDAYRQYLQAFPADSAAREHLVHLLIASDKYDEALAEMEKTEKGGAPSVESLKLRADILIGQKKYPQAIAALQQAAALAPQDAVLRGGIGRTYLQQRDFANAEKELKAAIRLDSKNLAYWRDLTTTYYLSGNYPSTLASLDQLAQREPPTAGELFVRALCYDKLQQTKAALEAYQKFLDADQNRDPDQVWQAQQRIIVLKKMLERNR